MEVVMKIKRITLSFLAVFLLSSCTVLYTHRDMAGDSSTWGKYQIYRMWGNGWSKTNISNRNRNEQLADIRNDGLKIVFVTTGNTVEIMDRDGTNPVPFPNVPTDSAYPRWSVGEIGYFILFAHPASHAQTAIWRVNEDGTELVQVTHPSATQADETASVIDDKFIIFSRYDSANNHDRDLYLKYMWDDRPIVRLTNTQNISESLPVVSNNKQMVAYRAFQSSAMDQIVVADIDRLNDTLNTISTISLRAPAAYNITGIDFSKDDSMLYFSAQANDVPGSLINRKQEIFRVNIDGTNQVRLTNNSDWDASPNAMP
jgi:hypothetical protein